MLSFKKLVILALYTSVMFSLVGLALSQEVTEEPGVPTLTADIVATQAALDAAATQSSLQVTQLHEANLATQTQQSVIITQTQEANFALATQQAIMATQTQEGLERQGTSVSLTQTQVYFATATATALTPMPTERFPTFSVSLTIDPPSATESYTTGSDITISILVANQGGGSPLNDRFIVVALPFDTEVFSEPAAGAISADGQFSNGTIKWTLNLVEGTSQVLTVVARGRDALTENADVNLRAVVRTTNEQVVLRQSDVVAFTVVANDQTTPSPTTITSSKEPQGTGLFQSELSFALLIGGFFAVGLALVFGLGMWSVAKADDDDIRESVFHSTAEILLLLIVLFSVIVMGVQNAIDRESINAIIGGIVGYVAGRVTSKATRVEDIVRALRPEHPTGPVISGNGGSSNTTNSTEDDSNSP